MMKKWKIALLDELLDCLIELNGVKWTIEWLLDNGYTREQLIELLFNPDDITEVEREE